MAKLTEKEGALFEAFKVNFLKANSESEIVFKAAKREKTFLRVDILRNGSSEWYHVTGQNNWY